MRIFDTHAHYDDSAFRADRKIVIESLEYIGVEAVTNIGCDIESSERSVELTEKYDFFYAAVGVIPGECGNMTDKDIEKLRRLAENNKKVVAIGEIGLDYYWDDNPDKDIQKKWFRAQIDLALDLKLPIVIHSRDAAEDTVNILTEYFPGNGSNRIYTADGGSAATDGTGICECPGVMHCYSYSAETAEQLLKTGLYFGIGGVITYKNAKKLVRAVEAIPIERIVLETDCPYLTPHPNRGKRNYSGYLPLVIEKLAEIKGLTSEEVAEITWNNAKTLYRIK